MSSKLAIFAILGVVVLFQGCASNPKPVVQSEKETQINNWVRAASKGDLEFIRKNLNMIKSQNVNGTTALMAACARGQEDVARFLIESGEEIDALDGNRDSALFYSITQNKENTFDLLLKNKAKAGGTRPDGITPLMIAVDTNRQSMIEKLVNYKVDLNEKTEDGWTALFFTVRLKNLKAAKYMIKAGAKPDIKDKDGKTPFNYAEEDGWMEGAHFFQKYESKSSKK